MKKMVQCEVIIMWEGKVVVGGREGEGRGVQNLFVKIVYIKSEGAPFGNTCGNDKT